MLSELVGNTIYDDEIHLSHLLFALIIWTLLALGLEKFIARFPRLSRYAAGTPDLIIRDGVVDFKAMKRNNLDFAQLGMLLRENNIFSLWKWLMPCSRRTAASAYCVRRTRKKSTAMQEINKAESAFPPTSLKTAASMKTH